MLISDMEKEGHTFGNQYGQILLLGFLHSSFLHLVRYGRVRGPEEGLHSREKEDF